MRTYIGITDSDVPDQIRGGPIHLRREKAPHIPVGLMFDAYGIAVGTTDMPSLVRLTHHLCDLSVQGTDDIMCGRTRITIAKPGNSPRIRA